MNLTGLFCRPGKIGESRTTRHSTKWNLYGPGMSESGAVPTVANSTLVRRARLEAAETADATLSGHFLHSGENAIGTQTHAINGIGCFPEGESLSPEGGALGTLEVTVVFLSIGLVQGRPCANLARGETPQTT